MIFGEVKAPGCEDCIQEHGRAFCTMNCSPRESVKHATISKGELLLFPHRSGWEETRHTVLTILEDFVLQEVRECPFGTYRITGANFGFDHQGARLFTFTYEVGHG